MRRRALIFGFHPARCPRAREGFAHEFFGSTDGEFLGLYPLGQPEHLIFGFEAQQRPGVSLGELSIGQEGPYTVWQLREAQGVGHGGPALAQPVGELLLGQPETLHEGLVGGRGLQGVQVLPLQVLHESQLHGHAVPRLPDENWHPVEPGLFRGPQPALPGYELEATLRRANDRRLQDTDLPDRGCELFDAGLGETAPWLTRVGADRRGRELLELQSPHAVPRGYERGEPASQAPPTHGSTPPGRRPRTPPPLCSWGRRARSATRKIGRAHV